jgi:hypothetical protein
MNFGQMTKNYAWKFGLADDLTSERFATLLGEGERMTDKRFEKATERFGQLREQIGKRWKIEGHDGKKKPKKR